MTSIANAPVPGVPASASPAEAALSAASAPASPGFAVPVDRSPDAGEPGLAAGMLSTAVSLMFVLLLAYAVLRLVKRFQPGRPGGGSPVHDTPRVLRTVALGAREKLVVVRYRERDYLLGVTPGAVTRLDADPAGAPRDTPAG